jgi:hypothetical protein
VDDRRPPRRYDPGVAAKRIFTYEEARALLPAVRERTREALSALAGAEPERDEEPGEEPDLFERRAARILEEWARDITALGIEVKGPWLVDFDCGGGYWCWRWPEETLEFFHGYEEGFAGRVRIQ